ncbi:MAG: thioredoxin domain-containing protein [Myxococcota bacterium]|nr:thioredoxin domain-containing protein [Myxococcota bacterium]
MSERTQRIGLWLLVPALLFGVFVGGLMTWHHDIQLYGSGEGELIGCVESAEVNCDIVNTSEYSELLGVPIATLAIGFYATVLVLVVLALRRRAGAHRLLLAAGVCAVLYSAFLFYISKTQLGFVCAWCIRLYGVNAALLAVGLIGRNTPTPPARLLLTIGAAWGALTLAAIGGERIYRSTLSDGEVIEVAKEGTHHDLDPEGDAPALSFTVQTEDKNEATFTIDPSDAWLGNPAAQVAVVEFADLECGYCKRMASQMARLEATYGDRVLFVFKHFPMDPTCNAGVKNRKHRKACMAAKAAVCAGKQRRFWAFQDLAFKNQHQLGESYLRTYAETVGADLEAYDQCMASNEAAQQVARDGEAGKSLDIHGTPRIFIDGKLYRSGSSAEVMARAIETALGTSPQEAVANAQGLRETRSVVKAIPDDIPLQQSISYGDISFEIDTFESGLNNGKAVAGKHEVPALRVSFYEAQEACEAAGKRMCTEQEWVTTCQGALALDDNNNGGFADDMIEGTAYPYADFHDRSRCWDGRKDPKFRPVYTGEMPGCVSRDGVYDMTGNVEEWVGTSPEDAVLLGGAWDTTKDHARCYRRNATYGPGYSSQRTGFRCCSG